MLIKLIEISQLYFKRIWEASLHRCTIWIENKTYHVEHVPVGSVVERSAGALTTHEQLLVASLHVQVRLDALVLEQISTEQTL